MKEIKWTLYTLYIILYTSLIWACFVFKGIPLGPNGIWVGAIFAVVITAVHIIVIAKYILEHWNDNG